MAAPSVSAGFAPVAAGTGKELALAMQKLWLVGRVLPAGARLVVRHTFQSSEPKPLEVIYAFALPRDAALRRFRVTGAGFAVHSELKPVDEAVRLYEAGIEQGHLATLARQYGDGLVNLSLGNLRPGEPITVCLELLAGVEARDEGLRFRFPFTLAPAYHSKVRAAEVRPGTGELELPEEEFGDLILPQFSRDTSSLHEVGFDLSVAMAQEVVEISSPSHAVRVEREGPKGGRVALAPDRDVPDRDLVLDVRTAAGTGQVLGGKDRSGRGRFAAIFPSTSFGRGSGEPRRVVFVLDRSGSMNGQPIRQARKALEACLGALSEPDRFGVVAFDDRTEVFQPGLIEGTLNVRQQAREFLAGIGARGGTELAAAVEEAARIAGRDGGDLLVLTDGQVFGTEKILEQARATHLRIHCLGIGSASQDRFLALLARETGGVSRFLTPRERVDVAAVDLFASIGRPVAADLEVKIEAAGGQIAPEPAASVFAGTPLVVFGEWDGADRGKLALAWKSGGGRRTLEAPLTAQPGRLGDTVRLLQGARLITDLESRLVSEGAAGKREQRRITERLEALSVAYGLASRRMALVAVVERAGDRAGEMPETRIVPVGLPQDTEFSSYFGRRPAMAQASLALPTTGARRAAFSIGPKMPFGLDLGVDFCRVTLPGAFEAAAPEPPFELEAGADELLEFASLMEPDGGLPGGDRQARVMRTILALLSFLKEGHTAWAGAFRTHVRKLMDFLKANEAAHPIVGDILNLAARGAALPGDWSKRALSPALWRELEEALRSTQP